MKGEYRFIKFANGAELREGVSGFFEFCNKDGHVVIGLRAILQETFDTLAEEAEEQA